MPFRQLPATDAQRFQALQAAFDKAATVAAGQLAFSAANKTLLDALLPQFGTLIGLRGTALAAQTNATDAQDTQGVRVRMWTSQFFQNLNMAIERGVIPSSARAFYQLDVSQAVLPKLNSEADLVLWAGRAVSGEAARVAAGGGPIQCPPITEVTPELSAYQALRSTQSTKKGDFDTAAENVDALRAAVDTLVQDIWDEVEFHFRHESSASMRNKTREYGVYYASRPGEPTVPGSPPAAPTGVTLTVDPSNVMTATWIAVTGADSYQVFKQQVGTDPDFVLAGTSTVTTLALGTFPPGTTVRAKVRALHGTTPSPDSAVVETSVTAPPL